MQTQPSSQDESPLSGSETEREGYSRENYFDSLDEEYELDEDVAEETADGRDWGRNHQFVDGKSKAEYVSHDILRGGATFLCPIASNEPDEWDLHERKQATELSEPEIHVPRESELNFRTIEFGQFRLRRRYNIKHGYVTFGGVLQDRPTEEFLEIVEDVLSWGIQTGNLRDSEAEILRREAQSMKSGGETNDDEIMELLVEAMEHSNGVEEFFNTKSAVQRIQEKQD